jgi:hypothetical protein
MKDIMTSKYWQLAWRVCILVALLWVGFELHQIRGDLRMAPDYDRQMTSIDEGVEAIRKHMNADLPDRGVPCGIYSECQK